LCQSSRLQSLPATFLPNPFIFFPPLGTLIESFFFPEHIGLFTETHNSGTQYGNLHTCILLFREIAHMVSIARLYFSNCSGAKLLFIADLADMQRSKQGWMVKRDPILLVTFKTAPGLNMCEVLSAT